MFGREIEGDSLSKFIFYFYFLIKSIIKLRIYSVEKVSLFIHNTTILVRSTIYLSLRQKLSFYRLYFEPYEKKTLKKLRI